MALAVGCDAPTAPGPIAITRVHPDWVTGAAAAAVDPATGLFILPPPADVELDVATVRGLAHGYLRAFVTENPLFNPRQAVEQDRGAPIDWDALQPCGRTIHVASALGPHPPIVPRVYHRLRAAQWAVSFCGRGAVELSIGVSDAPQSVALVEGELAWDHIDSVKGVFTTTGVPARYPTGSPLTPEDAVGFVFGVTRTRVSAPPLAFNQLSPSGIGHLPLCASWPLELEAPVSVTPLAGGPAEYVSELIVRHEPACFAPTISMYMVDASAPTSIWMHYVTGPPAMPTFDSVLVDAIGPTRFRQVQATPP